MRLAEVPRWTLARHLAGEGVGIDLGAARARIRTTVAECAEVFANLYRDFSLEPASGFFDVTVLLRQVRGLRRYLRPQVEVVADGETLFAPFPASLHLPMLEWGINYLLAERVGHMLLLHAGVVALNGKAVILPALPGSGKSTLTAALAARGFRLLSDEFGAVRLDDGQMLPMLRPIALKNEAIDVIRRFSPESLIGPPFEKTRKGTVAHMAPDARAIRLRHAPAAPALIVFPRYDPQVTFRIEPMKASRAFTRLAVNSFNYEMLGPSGFDAISNLIQRCRIYSLTYRALEPAVAALRELVGEGV